MPPQRARFWTAFTLGAAAASVVLVAWSFAPSEGFWSMDSFEEWEVAVPDYLAALPDDVRTGFADDGHALAYALATDCFAGLDPVSKVDRAVRTACAETNLAAVLNMDDLCRYLEHDGNRAVARINGSNLCGR